MSQVYFIGYEPDGLIKIGLCSHGGAHRLKALSGASPVPLTLLAAAPGNKDLEQLLHKTFAATRAHGEWFSRSPELVSFIEGVVRTGAIRVPEPLRVHPSAFGEIVAQGRGWRLYEGAPQEYCNSSSIGAYGARGVWWREEKNQSNRVILYDEAILGREEIAELQGITGVFHTLPVKDMF